MSDGVEQANIFERAVDRRAFLGRLGAGALLFVAPLPQRRPDAFSALAATGERYRGRVFLPGETIPWPVPVHVGSDWTLSFSDGPPLALLRSLGVRDTGQLTIVSNNVLIERTDSPELDYANGDRQVIYGAGTTPSPKPNRWRVRPALATERGTRGPAFDALRFDVGGRLQGFTPAGEQIRTPSQRYAVPYRVNWYRGGRRVQTIVDPASDLCVSEQPLAPGAYRFLCERVSFYRRAIVGAQPVVMVSGRRRLEDSTDSFEANYDPAASVALLNEWYLTRPEFHTVVDVLLGSAVFWSAAVSPIPLVHERAGTFARAAEHAGPGVRRLFGEEKRAGSDRLFATGLDAMARTPSAFRAGFEALGAPQQASARRIRNAIVALVRGGLELNGRSELLHDFAPRRVQQL